MFGGKSFLSALAQVPHTVKDAHKKIAIGRFHRQGSSLVSD